MLINFNVENYLSFMDKASLDLEAGSIREHSKNTINIKLGTQEIRVLKTITIMGANSAGKTNFLKGFLVMRNMVLNSSKDVHQASKEITPFLLNTKTENAPSSFEAIFIAKKVCYRYSFKATSEKIHEEYLSIIVKRKEENIFVRILDEITINKKFQREFQQRLNFVVDLTREKALFLSVLAQFKIDFAINISEWFLKSIVSFDSNIDSTINYTANLLSNEKYKFLIYDILKKTDLGFSSIEEEISEKSGSDKERLLLLSALYDEELRNFTIKTKHIKYKADFTPLHPVYFDLKKQESSGAQKFVALIGPIVKALVDGKLFWIDELDSKLHTLMVILIIDLFNSTKYNPNGAQLIVTTHNEQLLKKVRRDQMIFVNKNQYGISSLSSLYTSKPNVRSDASFDKDYLQGKFGGVPKINDQLIIDFNSGEEE
jgi:AAA15 family ATPase/GTPase